MPDALQEWVERLKKDEMPVFGSVAVQVSKLSQEKNVSTSRLANVILQDSSMTARVLKVANSSLYPKLSQVTTISRAITLLGFETVSKICLSVALVDALLKGRPKQALLKDMACTFYAGILARTIAERRRDESPEEVFVAALLYRLGRMAFWCFGGKAAESLQAIYEDNDVDHNKAEEVILRFKLHDLTKELAREWSLGSLLIKALDHYDEDTGRAKAIYLAHEFADLASIEGKGDERRALLRAIAEQAEVSIETMEELARATSQLAVDFAKRIGAEGTVPAIPGQKLIAQLITPIEENIVGDPLLQLRILRELVMLSSGDTEPDTILQLALEGLYRGTGLDRVVYLAPNEDSTQLKARFALSADQTEVLKSFSVSLKESNIFSEACKDDQSVWAPILPVNEKKLLSNGVQEILKNGPFLLAPIRARGNLIGMFYADRLSSGRPLDSECSESFELFCFQVRQILSSRHQ
jgi:HD-like signal output (HDOD) protein